MGRLTNMAIIIIVKAIWQRLGGGGGLPIMVKIWGGGQNILWPSHSNFWGAMACIRVLGILE